MYKFNIIKALGAKHMAMSFNYSVTYYLKYFLSKLFPKVNIDATTIVITSPHYFYFLFPLLIAI